MAKANTRQFDRMIRDAEAKLQGVRDRKTWALTGREQAKLAAYGSVVLAKGTRLKSSPTAERGMARVWSEAESRYAAEARAAQQAKEKVLADAAAAKVAKKSSGWW